MNDSDLLQRLKAAPIVQQVSGVSVVRDDLLPGGTKARFMCLLYQQADEIVYASPAEGGAQTALAVTARLMGKRATLFIAKRQQPHPRALMAKQWGAKIFQVSPGYLAVAQARARLYCADTGATLAPFGMDTPEALQAIAAAATATGQDPDEVWCAAGSGVLARALAVAFPRARRMAVQIGRDVSREEVAGAQIFKHPLKFGQACRIDPGFPSDPHYDAKAWQIMLANKGSGNVLFWNVTGPADPAAAPGGTAPGAS